MKSENKIKSRILLPIGVVIVFLLITSIMVISNLLNRELIRDTDERISGVNQLFDTALDSESELLNILIETYQKDEVIQNAWINRDRDSLLEYCTPILKHIQEDHNIAHFYFTDTDRVNFLRVHNPSRKGDTINRYTTVQASETGKASHGIELGWLGSFILRVVHPWEINGEHMGFIELGKRIEHITPTIAEILDVDLIFTIDKKQIDRTNWEKGLKEIGQTGNWDHFQHFVEIDKTFDEIPTEIRDKLKVEHSDHEYLRFDLSHNGRQFKCGFVQLFDASGNDVGDIIVFFDVTERLAAMHNLITLLVIISTIIGLVLLTLFYFFVGKIETQLETSRQELEAERQQLISIFDGMIEPVYVADTETYEMLYMNEAAKKQWGDGKGQKCHKILQGLDSPCEFCTNDKITDENQGKTYIWESQKMINQRWHRCMDRAIQWPDGRMVRFEMAIDITDQKQHDGILNEMKTAIEQAKDGIATADLDGNLKFANESWAEMHGFSAEELKGKHLSVFHTREQMENDVKPFNEVIFQKGFNEGEVGHVTKDGRIFPAWMSSSVLKNKDDEPVGLIGIARDITQQKRMEDALHERMTELEDFNRMATGREMKMIELKGEINELRTQLDKKRKYEIVK